MSNQSEPHTLGQVVERIDEAGHASGEEAQVSVRDVIESLGRRSYGPLILVPALIVVSPVGGVPGLPTVVAGIIAVLAAQLLLGRGSVWMPDVLMSRSISRKRLDQVSGFAKNLATYVDSVLSRRLSVLVEKPFHRVIAVFILGLCLVMPPLEIIPFGNSATGAAISVLALALIAHDGLLALIGMLLTGGLAAFTVSTLFG